MLPSLPDHIITDMPVRFVLRLEAGGRPPLPDRTEQVFPQAVIQGAGGVHQFPADGDQAIDVVVGGDAELEEAIVKPGQTDFRPLAAGDV